MRVMILFAALSFSTTNIAVAQLPWYPPEPPRVGDSDSKWDIWFAAWFAYQKAVNGYDVKGKRGYTLHADWSVQEDFSPDLADHTEKTVELHLRAFMRMTGFRDPYRCMGIAWGKAGNFVSKNITKSCQGTSIWNFKWVGSVGKNPPLGKVSGLKGRIMGLAYARAYNAFCGSYMAIPARWEDSFGRQLTCMLGVAGETDGQQVATLVGFPFWNITVTMNDGDSFATAKCKDHTPLHDAWKVGTPKRPWRVWVKHRAGLKAQVKGSNDSGPYSLAGWGVTESRGEVVMNFVGRFTSVGGAK